MARMTKAERAERAVYVLAGSTFCCEICGRKLVNHDTILRCPGPECGQMYCPYCSADISTACPHNLACISDWHWEVSPFAQLVVPKLPSSLHTKSERLDLAAKEVFGDLLQAWEIYRDYSGGSPEYQAAQTYPGEFLETTLYYQIFRKRLTVPIRSYRWDEPAWMTGVTGEIDYTIHRDDARRQLVDLLAQVGHHLYTLERNTQ